ncbi:phosphonate ABC transporter permease [Spiroplasma corruscae]|uniref:Phosphonate ABC transporter permease n=1 Tax=Spiroplasma corruscae TaxID=216934 RepID=A0A222ENU2_9MOLU|nr:ABC transporter permease subunit [Spiroplasma corruscae]ASP28170.1 phosphonate ABC transporter permease [Spiroplasma corruscae]
MIKRKINSLLSRNVFKVGERYSKSPSKIFMWSMIIITSLIVLFGFYYLENSWEEFFTSLSNLGTSIKEMLNWNFKEFATPNMFGETFLNNALQSVLSTITMSFSGTILGVLLAVPVALLSSYNLVHNRFVNNLCKSIMALFRTVPAFTFALFLIGYFGQTTLSVTLAIAIFTFAITGKLFLEKIEHINFKIYTSLQATGASKYSSFRSAVMPQISHSLLSLTFYSLETNIRYIAIIGGMTSVGIGELIQRNIGFQQWDRAGFLLFLLIMVVLLLELIIYLIKKYILSDKDFILDKKERDNIINKSKKLIRKSNLRYYIYEEFILKYKIEIKKTISWKSKFLLYKERTKKISQFKKLHKSKILEDKEKFKELKSKEFNSKNWFIYNDKLSQSVRRDKLYLTDFNLMVESRKSEYYLRTKKEVEEKHEEFLKSLTKDVVLHKNPRKYLKRWFLYAIIFAFFIYSFSTIEFHIESKEVIQNTNKTIWSVLNINWESLFSKTSNAPFSVIQLMFETLSIAIVGTTLGVLFSYILGLISSETIVNFYVAKFFVILTSIVRAIPTYIYAIIFVALVGLGPFNGAIALAMGSIGMLTKYNRETFEDINLKISTQLQATGLNGWQRFRYGIIPQTSSNVISYIIYRFDINFKEVSSLGIVGAGNMGYLLNTYFNDRYFNEFGALLFGIMVFTLLIETFTTILRNKINLGINPKYVDYLILKIKNYLFIKYKTNEMLYLKKQGLSFNESCALYSFTNNELFKSIKAIQKKDNLSKKNSYLKAYNELFNTSFVSIKEVNDNYKQLYKKYKTNRIEYIEKLNNEYIESLKTYKDNLKVFKNNEIYKNDIKFYIKEYYKSKKNAKRIFRIQKNSLD